MVLGEVFFLMSSSKESQAGAPAVKCSLTSFPPGLVRVYLILNYFLFTYTVTRYMILSYLIPFYFDRPSPKCLLLFKSMA